MSSVDFVVLYVKDLAASKKFYAGLLGREPRDLSPTFSQFKMDSGLALELCRLDKVDPPSTAGEGGMEFGWPVDSEAALRSTFEDWKRMGVAIAQEPKEQVYGLSVVCLDPDGHRIRIFVPKR
jgi:catechol 2,3-dioxygenase-like lactoylglutathione lyase family enzyme